jgi:hypothetical protein
MNSNVNFRLHKSRSPINFHGKHDPSLPRLIYLRFISILSSHLRLGLASGIFSLDFPKTFCTHLSPFACMQHATCLDHHTQFDNLIIFGEKYQLRPYVLCHFHHPPINSSLVRTHIFLSTLFSNALNLYHFLKIPFHSMPVQPNRVWPPLLRFLNIVI